VLIRVYAASVNPADWGALGRAPAPGAPLTRVPGLDVSGVIVAVGSGVTDRSVGMPVFGMVDHAGDALNGGYAQYSVANAASTAPTPRNLNFAEAAGLGVVGVTALRALDAGGVQAGQRVLITGVAGGVGSSAAQIALARGASVLGTASPRHAAFVRALGVSKFIDYTQGNIAGQAGATDVVIDTVGGSEALDAFHTVKPGGHFVSIARAGVTPEQCTAAQVQCSGSPGSAATAPVAVVLQVAQLAGQGKLTTHVDQSFPLQNAVDALQYVHQGHTEGKVILAVTKQAANR
jgi:NADPH:quinone reductase-like Zn-dependent oxidoreductase